MNGSDLLLARWRTFVQAQAGVWVTWLANWLAERGGVVDDQMIDAGVAVVAGLGVSAYYVAATWVKQRWPRLGSVLLGSKKQPRYTEPPN